MPQMAPLWWELMYMLFIITYIMMNIIMFYGVGSDVYVRLSAKEKIKYMNWKW
uniref:ATPase subunit 8 n=1 Tax=Sadoletus valdezi TaxID=2813444 RepID=A0A8T9ZXA0_9HEMI|nr:ATPase subunit 8 [Sadoletus valdezi]